MTITELYDKQFKFAALFASLINWINLQDGYRCTIGEVERPQVLQDIYVKEKKTEVKVSDHSYNIAGDIRIFKLIGGKWVYLEKTEDYKFAGEHWESMDKDCVWGGRFGDNPATEKIEGWDGNHFQVRRV